MVVRAVADEAPTTLEHADGAAVELSSVLGEAQATLKSNEESIQITMDNLKQMSEDAKGLAAELRKQPSLLRRTPKKGVKPPGP